MQNQRRSRGNGRVRTDEAVSRTLSGVFAESTTIWGRQPPAWRQEEDVYVSALVSDFRRRLASSRPETDRLQRASPCFPRSAQPPAVHLQVGALLFFTSPACLSDTGRRQKAIHRIAAATTWHTTWWGCAPSMAPKRTVFKRPAAFKRQAGTEAEPSSTPRHTNKGVCQVQGCTCRTPICAYTGCCLLCKEKPPPQAWAPES